MATKAAMNRLVSVRTSSVAVGFKSAAPLQAHRSISSSSSRGQDDQLAATVASTSGGKSHSSAIPLPSPFEAALTLPRTHNHHVASLHLRAHGPGQTLQNLDYFSDFALRAGYALGIPMSRPASLPTRTSLWTVPKGPFVHKKSQENFQRRVHKRLIKVWDADMEVVERWLHFLRIHAMDGVGMRAELYRNFPLSIGSSLLAASTSNLRSISGESQGQGDMTLRASEADSDQVARLAKAIIEEEVAKQDAEEVAEQAVLSEAKNSNLNNSEEVVDEKNAESVQAGEATVETGKEDGQAGETETKPM